MAEKIFNNSDSKQETCFAFKIETRESGVIVRHMHGEYVSNIRIWISR